jgi:signal transduction histidine kinase
MLIIILVTVLVALVVIGTEIVTGWRVDRAVRRDDIASRLSEAVFERIATRSEWLLLHDETTASRWRRLHQEVENLLDDAKLEFEGTPVHNEILELIREQPVLADYFNRLEENWAVGQAGQIGQDTVKATEGELVGEMTSIAQGFYDFSTRLKEESRDDVESAVRTNVITSVALVSLLAILVLAGGLAISLSVLRGLSSLREGTEKISAGDLDYRIDESGMGEMADFARSFNEMTAKLGGKAALLEGLGVMYRETLAAESAADLARVCLSVAQKLTGSRFGFMGTLNEEGRLDVKVLSETGLEECAMPELEATRQLADMEIKSYWGRVFTEGRPQIVNDPLSDPDSSGTPHGHPTISSFLGVPLFGGRKTVGIIALANREGGYTIEQAEDLSAIGLAYMEVAARQKAEQEVRLHRDHLEELVEERTGELRDSEAAQARQAEELKDMLDIASHELRHPATVFKGYSYILLENVDSLDSDVAREALASIDRASDRIVRIVDQLMDVTRISRGEIEPRWEDIDPNALLNGVVFEFENARAEINVNVQTEGAFRGDREMLRTILTNLIDNAIKFAPEGTSVETGALVATDGVIMFVGDRGPGIPEAHANRIFDRFYQVEDLQHHSTPGMGLGLFVAKALVEAHGGWIRYSRREGGGTVFEFFIPARSR